MANIEDVFGGIKSRVDDNPLGASATSVTVQNEFTGLDVGVPGYLTIGDPQDALPGDNGEVPTSEFVRYEGFTRNGDGTSTFGSLTRGLRNSTAQEWPQGTIIGVSIPGELLQRLPRQEEPFDMNNNSIDRVLTATFNGEYDNGTVSSNTTIDFTNGQKQVVTLGASITLSFTDPAGPCNLVLKVVQDGTGGRDVTWPSSVLWPGGSKTALSNSADAVDVVSFYYDGTNYHAQMGRAFA